MKRAVRKVNKCLKIHSQSPRVLVMLLLCHIPETTQRERTKKKQFQFHNAVRESREDVQSRKKK